MNQLYPRISPYATHRVDIGGGHLAYVEESGNPEGRAVLFLHGGPGSGCNAGHRRYFDPQHYRIVLVDQRGCGRSTPAGDTLANTTDLLVQDLECIRRWLRIDRWLLFGGSWGATLALAYAQRHPALVTGVILRGTFLARRADLDWFFGTDGVARIFPDAYAGFIGSVPTEERGDLIGAYHRRVHGPDAAVAFDWALNWTRWADRIATSTLPPSDQKGEPDRQRLLEKVRIETHYAVNGHFLADRSLLDAVPRLPDVPVSIVHGRRDLVCPVDAAWILHRKIPGSRLILLPDAGHLAIESAMIDALVGETDRLR